MRPTPRLMRLIALWFASGIATALWPDALLVVWGFLGVALLAALGVDGVFALKAPRPTAERQVGSSLPLGAWSWVQITLHNPASFGLNLEVFDHHPVGFLVRHQPVEVTVPARTHAVIRYQLQATTRGDHQFGQTQVLIASPLGLLKRQVFCSKEEDVRVFPNFSAVAKYALLAIDNRLSQMGVLKRRRRGEGLEFHQLRDYRKGDALRQVDWKATSRQQRLISREYQEEKNQQVLFLLDCGRRMHAKDGLLSHFDHALNAVLLLTYVALRQGDAAGLATFSGSDRWLAPKSGPAAMTRILNSVYDLNTSTQPPDYTQMATTLLARQKRRALVIVISNLRDEDASELGPALQLLKKRHLVMLASLREMVVGEALNKEVFNLEDALRASSAHHYLAARRAAHDRLQHKGVLVEDVAPRELPLRLVNRYLDIKGSGRL